MQVESLEQLAKRLGWSAERLQQAHDRAAEPRPANATDRDQARAQALSDALKQTSDTP